LVIHLFCLASPRPIQVQNSALVLDWIAATRAHQSRARVVVLRFLNGARGLADYAKNELGLRQHRDMTAVGLDDGRAHAFRDKALQLGMYGAVVLGHDEPARFRPPRSPFDPLREKIRDRHSLGCPNQLLLLLREVSRKTSDAVWLQPDTSIRDFDM
jgi:hypothetical protein